MTLYQKLLNIILSISKINTIMMIQYNNDLYNNDEKTINI